MFSSTLALALALATMPSSILPSGFRVDHQGDVAWLVNPFGKRFLANGVCCVNPGLTREEWTEMNPGYAAFRSYASDAEWARSTAKRLQSWGFNTIGAWSSHELFADSGMPQTPVLHLLAAGIPWLDPWDPEVVAKVREVARPQVERWRKIPGTIGYFSDNELGWWQAMLWEFAWRFKAEGPGRSKLISFLRRRYPTWEKVVEDFDPEGASSFEDLSQKGRLFLRPGSQGSQTVRAWIEILADRYYALCRQVIQELHPGALFLGDRYIAVYFPEVAKAAGRHCDVVSTNINANWNDGVFPPFFVPGLYRLAKRPIMLTEFYAAAMENRSGNLNDSAEFPTVRTQSERNRLLETQVRYLLSLPYVVGVHWFQYYDEPTHGRGDGENFNMGLVDIENRPYEGLVRAARRALATPKSQPKTPDRCAPYVAPEHGRELRGWDRHAAALPQTDGEPRGDAFLAWNENGLYLGMLWHEDVAEAFYRNGMVPSEDQAEITVRFASDVDVTAKIGGIKPVEQKGANLLSHKLGIRNELVLRVSPNAFKQARFRAGETIPFRIVLRTRARLYTCEWAGEATLLSP